MKGKGTYRVEIKEVVDGLDGGAVMLEFHLQFQDGLCEAWRQLLLLLHETRLVRGGCLFHLRLRLCPLSLRQGKCGSRLCL